MGKERIEIIVYGADQVCASCVNAPSSRDTYEWLDAALSRKFPEQPFQMTYVDIFKEQHVEAHKDFCQQIIEDDLFYPVVVIEDEIVGEGIIQLKKIVQAMEQHGYRIAEQ
ncbi:YuzD family protein [Bacillus massiliigorillae]|uniref:YuzD family protein n=1 Tax=Bacillus massiliigorillae TaxID=1243664 RepID=UPI00039B2C18|nr:YuzD family protein [Bacillus massiliigorillae]